MSFAAVVALGADVGSAGDSCPFSNAGRLFCAGVSAASLARVSSARGE